MKKLEGQNVFFVGIKGTGVSALADLYKSLGANVTGSDSKEIFYTDEVLKNQGIKWVESFDAELLPKETTMVVHSSAYDVQKNPQLSEAAKRGIPILEYSKALGALSQNSFGVGICGVHGKTTTTALVGSVVQAMKLKGSVLVGSALPQFDNRSIYCGGDDFFVAETCEYKRHFLNFSPSALILTSVEIDHLDYFKDEEDIQNAFIEYGEKIADDGLLIFCKDDAGATFCANKIKESANKSGKNLTLIEYGFSAGGDYKITSNAVEDGKNSFTLAAFQNPFELKVPGKHLVLNAAAVVALISYLAKKEGIADTEIFDGIKKGFANFLGSRRRSELVGEAQGITIIDDYGHHPSAIKLTLAGYKEFYKGRRLIVDFMSHTYSRTEGLLEEFASSFESADIVLLNKIYSSAREKEGSVTGKTLFETAKKYHNNVHYFEEYIDALPFLLSTLKRGDIFITMGAGDNWQLGVALLKKLNEAQQNNG